MTGVAKRKKGETVILWLICKLRTLGSIAIILEQLVTRRANHTQCYNFAITIKTICRTNDITILKDQ